MECEKKTTKWVHTRILSNAEGFPPLWTWPRIVTRASSPSLSTITFFTFSEVIGFPSWSTAPSATITMLSLLPSFLSWIDGKKKIFINAPYKKINLYLNRKNNRTLNCLISLIQLSVLKNPFNKQNLEPFFLI